MADMVIFKGVAHDRLQQINYPQCVFGSIALPSGRLRLLADVARRKHGSITLLRVGDYTLKCDASASAAIEGFAKYFCRSPNRLGPGIPLHWLSGPSLNALLLRRKLLQIGRRGIEQVAQYGDFGCDPGSDCRWRVGGK